MAEQKPDSDWLVDKWKEITDLMIILSGEPYIDDQLEIQEIWDLVADMLKSGKNAVGAMLAPGYFDARNNRIGAFGSPRFICRIEIEYADGTKQSIVSDESWKAHRSGITKSDLHEGENYDARLEIPDWCSPDFDDSSR